MPDLYLVMVFLLFALAITDLVVGVSNDAVNFLNSAIGSKVAPRKIIMIVASLGILFGATFSSGMMEVARKGIFNPAFFQFSDIMVIFLAVMLTDIILLDLFNTFGMPTSTTVSIVFELLGASVMVATIKIFAAGAPWSTLSDYINSSSALTIIAGIFLSVGIAFTIGVLVQYLSRLLLTFHYYKRLKWIGSLWTGLALAALTYFLLIKGIKGASFVSDEFVSWVMDNTWLLLLGSFILWTILMQILLSVFKVNVLRVVVLFGTFALAMAFAGNDLVNFIGVPIAGFESYNFWSASGLAPDELSMSQLNRAYPTNTLLLLAAGIIMIVTLWLSKKARSVTETEVNLGRQHEGLERFSPNGLSKGIVRYSRYVGIGLRQVLPDSWIEKTEQQFKPRVFTKAARENGDIPAFDLVRASVNLTVASMLIALATSYKLPLSTTYVSFMVAMGTSLADRAWGRDSAVYRVAGVLNVIGGWFLTAVIAFTVAGVFAFCLYHFGGTAMVILVLLAAFFIFRSFAYHRDKEKSKARLLAFQKANQVIPLPELIRETVDNLTELLLTVRKAYEAALDGLLREELNTVRGAQRLLQKLQQENEEFKYKFYGAMKRIQENASGGSRAYLLIYDLEQDLLQSTGFIVEACREHIENSHLPLTKDQADQLLNIKNQLYEYLGLILQTLNDRTYSDLTPILKTKKALFIQLEEMLSGQVDGIKQETYNARNSLLYFSLALETKDLIAVAARFVKLYHRLDNGEKEPLLLSDHEQALRGN